MYSLLDFSLRNRWLVLLLLALFIAIGCFVAVQIPIDAFPDLTNNQVVVITECPAMPPTEVEQLVTFPIESALMGMPRTEGIRSISKFGLSIVTLVFNDSVNTYFARQLVNERLQELRSRLPQDLQPSMGPVATAFGEVYQYTVESPDMPVMDRKTLHDWQIRYALRTIPGVNEVNSWGGLTKQYIVQTDPEALRRYGITLQTVLERVEQNNSNFGGGFFNHADEQYTVLGRGRARAPADLGEIVLLERNGVPVLLHDVAEVVTGAVPRQGAVLRDAKGETVSGMAIMLKGENGRRVIERVKQRLASLRLPAGVRLVPFYDQSEIIDATIHTVGRNLLEAGALVITVLLLFLGNLRAALIVAAVIPISMLFGFVGMAVFGISANLMSLGAIDFGMIVDGAVVMMENSVRRVAEHPEANAREAVRDAAHEVARPIVFAVSIIVAVYLPIFFLEGLEGRMFRPMAITVCSALIGSLLLAVTVVPALASLSLTRAAKEGQSRWFEWTRRCYERSLAAVLRHPAPTLAVAVVLVIAALGSLRFIGTEFMPRLDEGSLLIETRKLPGVSVPASVRISEQVEKAILQFPEVRGVVSKIGRPDLATEAMGVYEADVYVLLKPYDQWARGKTKDDLIRELAEGLEKIPGVAYNFTQPMAMRLDESVSGIKADVAVKIYGDDPVQLEQLADRALRLISTVPGAADAQMERISGVAELHVEVDRTALARYGLSVAAVREVVDTATGGRKVSEMIEGQRRVPITVRLPERYRADPYSLGYLVLQAPGGERVRLNQVTAMKVERGPEVVSREKAQRRIVVQANVRGRDLGSFVQAAQGKIEQGMPLPPGYSVEWGGQFENQARATRRLGFVLPASLLIIFCLLFATFQSPGQAMLILCAVPFALVGGIAALWIRGLNLSLSASVGFIALSGVAVLNGIVMVSSINRLRHSMDVAAAVREGASVRLRPVLMTALVASFGFVPMALSHAPGAEVQRPLATVVIGGLLTSTLLTLYLVPLCFPWFSPKAIDEL